MFSKRIFFAGLVFCLLALLVLPSQATSAVPNGVDHLRGRWNGTFLAMQGADQPFTLMLEEFASDPLQPELTNYVGCMALNQKPTLAPVAVQVKKLDAITFELAMYGTVITNQGASTIKVTGQVIDPEASVVSDSGSGAWNTGVEQGNWTVMHHDRRNFECPPVETGGGLNLISYITAAVGTRGETIEQQITIFGTETNIVSSNVQVILPDGSQILVPFYTDLFSPYVDFINSFRFSDSRSGMPTSGGVYTFTLLNALGQPIPGTTRTDLWNGCGGLEPPRNFVETLVPEGIMVTWDPVPVSVGFNPGGSPSLGMYQLGVNPIGGGRGYFGSEMKQNSHLIPYASFVDETRGVPDGLNYGVGINDMPDGQYEIGAWTFSQPIPGGASEGIKCQTRDFAEDLRFQKSGSLITFLP